MVKVNNSLLIRFIVSSLKRNVRLEAGRWLHAAFQTKTGVKLLLIGTDGNVNLWTCS